MSARSSAAGVFRQAVPAIGLSVERATNRVPADGCFYVVQGDDVKGRFRNKNQALALYRQLFAGSGYIPAPAQRSTQSTETVERYLDELETYWSESHRFARRGGKGRY